MILTYYWPPAGGSGVQRWLKFVKYLRQYDWEPIVFTVAKGEYPEIDNSLEADIPENITVLKGKIWEPYSLYKRFVGRKPDERIHTGFLTEKKKNPWAEKLAVLVRSNVFIPDARVGWIQPSVNYLSKWLQSNRVDAIVSNGPPHSTHLIAHALKQKFDLPWLADFRDPWTNIDYFQHLKLSSWAMAKHKRLEKKVISSCDALTVVSRQMKEEFEQIVPRKIEVITNGYDKSDFAEHVALDAAFTISHIGSLNKDRNCVHFWEALDALCKENPEFKQKLELRLIGKTDYSARHYLQGTSIPVTYINYLPHNEVTRYAAASRVLLLSLNNAPNAEGILTGKLFEYLAAKRPIVCIGPPQGGCAQVIKETHAGVTLHFDDIQGMKMQLLDFFQRYQSGTDVLNSHTIEAYSREALTGRMAAVLNEIKKKSL